jgi:hypothetical protein
VDHDDTKTGRELAAATPEEAPLRYLIGAFGAVVIVLGAAPGLAAAAIVGCGRVTTFVAPNSAAALVNSDGWLIFAKPDGTSDKVIIRAGTQVGALSGYVCIGIDSIYLTAVVAPGMAGYVPEPADWVTGTVVYCGTIAANSFTSGQLSGPRTFELIVTSGPAGGERFAVPASIPLPTIGSYLCGRFERGGPNSLVAVLRAGDAGYVTAGLPNTSTSVDAATSMPILGAFGAALLAVLAVLSRRARRDSKRCVHHTSA